MFFFFFLKADAQYSSSQSSSNTLSSNASSSAHSDEKWYDAGSRSGIRGDLELNGYLQGASADSGIDATSFTATQSSTASSTGAFRVKDKMSWQEDAAGGPRVASTSPPTLDSHAAVGVSDVQPGFENGSFGVNDTASHSRCAPVLLAPPLVAAEEFWPFKKKKEKKSTDSDLFIVI